VQSFHLPAVPEGGGTNVSQPPGVLEKKKSAVLGEKKMQAKKNLDKWCTYYGEK